MISGIGDGLLPQWQSVTCGGDRNRAKLRQKELGSNELHRQRIPAISSGDGQRKPLRRPTPRIVLQPVPTLKQLRWTYFRKSPASQEAEHALIALDVGL